MTTFKKITSVCSICGTSGEYKEIMSMYSSGQDLDTNPWDYILLESQIQTCQRCGYCTSDISIPANDWIKDTINSAEYIKQLNDDKFPKVSKSYLCGAILKIGLKDFASAGMYCLRAAWECDIHVKLCRISGQGQIAENITLASAIECRKKAIDLLIKAQGLKQKYGKDQIVEDVIIIDALRRNGQFERASEKCIAALEGLENGLGRNILRYEQLLIGKSDNASHSVEHVEEAIVIPDIVQDLSAKLDARQKLNAYQSPPVLQSVKQKEKIIRIKHAKWHSPPPWQEAWDSIDRGTQIFGIVVVIFWCIMVLIYVLVQMG